MSVSVVLVLQPSVDFTVLVDLLNRMLGYNPAKASDSNRLKQSDAEKLLSILSSMSDRETVAGLQPTLLAHASFSVLIAADERDLLDILECAAGMPFVKAETTVRGLYAAFITGTLAQWRDAVKTGATQKQDRTVRDCYCKIMGLFEQAGLASAWKDFTIEPLRDNTFILEDKRR